MLKITISADTKEEAEAAAEHTAKCLTLRRIKKPPTEPGKRNKIYLQGKIKDIEKREKIP